MRPIFLLLIFIVVLAVIFIINSFAGRRYVDVRIGEVVIKAELADTYLKRAGGLAGRNSLQDDEGMLFVFDSEGYYSFWMMDMRFPIDIIFMDKDRTVVDIWKDAQPCTLTCESYRPKEKAMYVLEVKANLTEEIGLKTGSKVGFELG